MENFKIGFIGGGALTESVVKGIVGKFLSAENIFVSDHKKNRCDELKKNYKINSEVGAENFLSEVKILIFAVKPKDAEKTFAEVQNKIPADTIILSAIAGLKISAIKNFFPKNPICRVMPNVALSVGEGMTAYSADEKISDAEKVLIKNFWSAVGRAVEVDEKLLDAVTGLSGSGSAYAFLMIDALADGGVLAGLSRKISIELAAQTLLGAAKMVLETGEHPDALRDKVASPAGTTIEGIRILERGGVRSSLIEAVIAATEKSKKLSEG